MSFLKAGFNARNQKTGIYAWTRPVDGGKFALAELRRFDSGDYFWLGVGKHAFLAWGHTCVFGSRPEFNLPRHWQDGLPQSAYPTPARRPRHVKLVLPYPVSANRYWTAFFASRKKRVINRVTDEAEAYKQECGWRAKASGVHSPFEGSVELRVRLIPENRVCMDLDNCLKVTIDALKGVVYHDDDQVMRIVAERAEPDPSGKRLEVEVLPYSAPTELEAAAST